VWLAVVAVFASNYQPIYLRSPHKSSLFPVPRTKGQRAFAQPPDCRLNGTFERHAQAAAVGGIDPDLEQIREVSRNTDILENSDRP